MTQSPTNKYKNVTNILTTYLIASGSLLGDTLICIECRKLDGSERVV